MLGWELPPYNSGGLGVACYQLCRTLATKPVDLSFVLPYKADHSIDFMKIIAGHNQSAFDLQSTGNVYDSRFYARATDNISDETSLFSQISKYEASVERITELERFDIIHAHDWLTCRAGLRAKEVSGAPLVVHFHSIEADRAGQPGRGNPLVREIESQALQLADHIIAVSEHTKQAIIREYQVSPDNIEVIHNSIDRGWYETLDNHTAYTYLEAMRSQGYRVVVNIGRLTIQKGLTNLLYAASEVLKRAPKTLFLIVGSGEQQQQLIELAAQLGISRNVIFTGFQRGKRLRDAFAIGDLFVMPSVSEPFGLTPLEAIGYGTPVLISKQSGVGEVLRNALKVDYWDVHEMANQIATVVQNDGLRDELQAQALSEYDRLSWNKAADRLYETYQRHLKSGATTGVVA